MKNYCKLGLTAIVVAGVFSACSAFGGKTTCCDKCSTKIESEQARGRLGEKSAAEIQSGQLETSDGSAKKKAQQGRFKDLGLFSKP